MLKCLHFKTQISINPNIKQHQDLCADNLAAIPECLPKEHNYADWVKSGIFGRAATMLVAYFKYWNKK